MVAGQIGRRPEGRDAEYLIDGEDENAEHQMAFHLDGAAHAHEPAAEFILQSRVDAFDHGAKIIERVVRVGHSDGFHARDFRGAFGFCFVLSAKIGIDQRNMAERLALLVDGGGS